MSHVQHPQGNPIDSSKLDELRMLSDGDTPDLHRLAAQWLGRAKNDAVQRNGHSAAR
jgi:hypothetical protein